MRKVIRHALNRRRWCGDKAARHIASQFIQFWSNLGGEGTRHKERAWLFFEYKCEWPNLKRSLNVVDGDEVSEHSIDFRVKTDSAQCAEHVKCDISGIQFAFSICN